VLVPFLFSTSPTRAPSMILMFGSTKLLANVLMFLSSLLVTNLISTMLVLLIVMLFFLMFVSIILTISRPLPSLLIMSTSSFIMLVVLVFNIATKHSSFAKSMFSNTFTFPLFSYFKKLKFLSSYCFLVYSR